MKAQAKSTRPGKKRYVHDRRKKRIRRSCEVIASADFLHDPKRAIALAVKGTQVCIKSGKVTIIFGLHPTKAGVARRKSYRAMMGARFLKLTNASEPLNVSWIE